MIRPWSEQTKRWVLTGVVVVVLILAYTLRTVLTPFILGAILAYILDPFVHFITRWTRMPRALAAFLVYLALFLAVLVGVVRLTPVLIHQVRTLDLHLASVSTYVRQLMAEYPGIELFGLHINLKPYYSEAFDSLTQISPSAISTSIAMAMRFASGFASTVVGLILTLVSSFYLVVDAPQIVRYVDGLFPPEYQAEFIQLRREVAQVWNAFFRGQLILCLVVGLATGFALWIAGVRSSLILGIIAGVLEIVPNVGPTLSAVPAVVIALAQGSLHWPIPNVPFALVVIGIYVVVQQLENHLLVPRILGNSVNLHPVVVLIGVVAGASLAGMVGLFLAAPLLGTLRVVGRYTYRKMLDLEPFTSEAERATLTRSPVSHRERVPDSHPIGERPAMLTRPSPGSQEAPSH